MSAIFAQPQFRKEFLTDKNIALIEQMFDSVVDTIVAGRGEEDKLYKEINQKIKKVEKSC